MDIVVIDHQDDLARLLADGGRNVHFFDDPALACRHLENAHRTIVFLGFETLKSQLFEGIRQIYGALSNEGAVIVTGVSLDEDSIVDCLIAGAKGYLDHRDAEISVVEKLIQAIANGEAWVARRLVARLLQRLHSNSALSGIGDFS